MFFFIPLGCLTGCPTEAIDETICANQRCTPTPIRTDRVPPNYYLGRVIFSLVEHRDFAPVNQAQF